MRKRLAAWNPIRGIWETDQIDLLSEHSEPFWETWPTSGTTRDGAAFELPTPALLTRDSESSSSHGLLPTPDAYAGSRGGSQDPDKRKSGGHTVSLQDVAEHQLLPTPTTALGSSGQTSRSGSRKDEILLPGIVQQLLPTPTVMDAEASGGTSTRNRTLTDATVREQMGTRPNPRLLPTPSAMVANDGEQPETWLARRARHKARGINGNGMGMPLTIAAVILSSGDLTPLSSEDGSESSDE